MGISYRPDNPFAKPAKEYHPDNPFAPRDATATAPKQPDALSTRVLRNVGSALTQMVTHPIETAESVVTAPLKSFADAVLSPSVGEARHNPNLSKGGNSAHLTPEQIATPYDAEHGAVTGKQRLAAGAQTAANIAFPGIANAVTGRAAAAGIPNVLARVMGTATAGGAAGAAYDPDDPMAGFATGAILTPAIAGTAKGIGTATGRSATALGLRPTGRTAVEMALDDARMRAPIGAEAGAASATPAAETSAGARPALPPQGVPPRPTVVDRARAAAGKVAVKAGVESSKTIALRELARRLQLDNVAPDNALALARNNPTKPVAVLDLGDGNVAGLMRTAKDVPGMARRDIPQFLKERSAGNDGATLDRVTQDFERRIGLKPEDYYATVDDMAKSMKAKAAEDYGKIRGTVIDDPEVLSLFDEPEFQAIHDRLRTNARLGGKEKIAPLSTVENIGGEEVRTLNPQTLGTLDKVKRQLDKIIAGKSEAVGTVDRDQAYNMRERVNAILDRMDELHPDYGKARAQYRGSAEAIDAYEAGKQDFTTQDPRLTAKKLADMPERVRDVYRRGQYDALRVRLSKMDDGANIGRFLDKNPDIRARVAALAKNPEDAAALRGDLGIERAMGDRKYQILGGPNTAERLIEHWSTVPMVTQLGNVARRVPLIGNLGGGAIDNVLSRRLSQQTGDVMGEVGKLGIRSGPDALSQTFDEIRQLIAADEAKALRRKRTAATIGATSSSPDRQ